MYLHYFIYSDVLIVTCLLVIRVDACPWITKNKFDAEMRSESIYLVPHLKQATQCPHGRKKQSLGASKQIAQRRRVLLLSSPSLNDFPSREDAVKNSSRFPSSVEIESWDEPQLERSSSLCESRGALADSTSPCWNPIPPSRSHRNLFKKLKAASMIIVIPPTQVRNGKNVL